MSVDAEKSAVRQILGESVPVVSWEEKLEPALYDGKEVLIWLNKSSGYREDVDILAKTFLKRAKSVHELVNEEEGIGYSPSEAAAWNMTPETFEGWKKTVIRECKPGMFRETKADTPQGEFIDQKEDGPYSTWLELGLTLNKNNSPVMNEDNVLRVLEGVDALKDVFWLDSFSGAPMATFGNKTKQWTDSDSLLLCIDIQRKLGFSTLKQNMVHSAVMAACARNQRHPVKEWLKPLLWDGKPRLDGFLRDYMGAADTPFNTACSRNMFISMLARIYQPGCKVDNMLILEGGQGKRKSSALKAIAGEWFVECNETLAGNHKDFLAILHGKMIAEIAELDSFSKAETTKIKAIISTASDRYRPPYGRLAETFCRTSIFVGTTNDHNYLSDPTGGRRFWPVAIGHIDIPAITRDRDQLFAEALVEYRAGKSWWEVPQDAAIDLQEARRKQDPWEVLISEYLLCKDSTTSDEIMKECLDIPADKRDQRGAMRVANCMKALGWANKPERVGTKMHRVWRKQNHVTGTLQ